MKIMQKKIVLLACVLCLFTMAGCAGKEEGQGHIVEELEDPEAKDSGEAADGDPAEDPDAAQPENMAGTETPDEDSLEDPEAKDGGEAADEDPAGDPDAAQPENTTGTELLEGSVTSIGETSVVVNKTFTDETEDGALLAVVKNDDNAVLITVNFSEDMRYELKTVRNGGVNGDADVTITEASFSDIKKGSSVKFTGYYVSDTEFAANSVSIYDFV